MSNFAYISGDPDNLTGGAGANMVDIQGPFVDLATWLNTDLQPRVAAAVPSFVTSLPVSAVDGQEIYYLADDTNGIVWHLRYRATSASSYKWEYVGGAPLQSDTSGAGTIASATYVDIPTNPGPSIVVPLAGDYRLLGLGYMFDNQVSTAFTGFLAAQIGASVPADTDAFATFQGVTNASGNAVSMTGGREIRRNVPAAATTVKMVARTAAGSPVVASRSLTIAPIRVG